MERKITECHVTLERDGSNVTSTFYVSNPVHMKSCEHMIAGYIADRLVFSVTYS